MNKNYSNKQKPQTKETSYKNQPAWLTTMQVLTGLLALAIIAFLIRGTYSSDAELNFITFSPLVLLVGAIFLSVTVKGKMKWLWIGVAIIESVSIALLLITFNSLQIQF